MPPDRTTKAPLRQATLFAFTKPTPSIANSAATKPTTEDAHAPAQLTPSAISAEKPRLSPRREKFASSVASRSPAKAKAGDEDRSFADVLLSIKPEFTELIAARKKNHEYRKYKLKESVQHLWLYETAPTSAITYVMSTTAPKVPGQVKDPSGVGNDDFDNGLKKSKYGYPVTALYRLRKPLTTAQLKERFGIAVPQGWRYATQKLVEELPLEGMEKVF